MEYDALKEKQMSLRFKRHQGLFLLLGLVPAVLILGSLLWACSGGLGLGLPSSESTLAPERGGDTGAGAAANPVTEPMADPVTQPVTGSVADRDNGQGEERDAVDDPAWDVSEAIQITLDGNSASAIGAGAIVNDSQVTITSAGTYNIRGSLRDGQILVDTQDEAPVTLILNGVDISNSSSAPIYVANAEETVIVLADETDNHISDGGSYVLEAEDDEPNAALFSQDDLTISGNGALTVDGNYNDGIASKDGLVITGGTITVSSVDDGIRSKDHIIVQDGYITVTAEGDGLKSDSEDDATQGTILIEDGVANITSGGDAIAAQTAVTITGGDLHLTSGGGSKGRMAESASAKGIKGVTSVRIDGGTLTIDSADDAIHSNGTIAINGGTYVLASGDDGMHADSTLEVNGGTVSVAECFEGIESAVITINDGEVHIVSSDDAINVAGGNDGSGMNGGPGFGGGHGGGPGQDGFAYSGDQYLYINGGYIVVDADGDGIDVNGSIEMTDGVVLVNGPTERMNGALDYYGAFTITGGFLVAAGSSGMAQSPSESSTQYSVLLNFGGTVQAGTLLQIRSVEGDAILTFAPTKDYETIVLSSPELDRATYDVYLGGRSTGSARDGLYQDGTVSSNTDTGSFSISAIVTWVGRGSR